MEIREVTQNKKTYMDLLFLADEQEDMIDRYLDRGVMFVLDDGGVKAECVVTDEGNGVLEIKNIAVAPRSRRRGYGRLLIEFVRQRYQDRFQTLQVGTGDSPLTIPFYEACGFVESHRVKNFFTDNYDHPIFECGVQLVDMVYLKKELG
ncbi:MAG: GNAT family N-acetyltransferase [Candidatus Heteroscillospira sp.]|jgi:GNAT superfamily N-acetyltransferase